MKGLNKYLMDKTAAGGSIVPRIACVDGLVLSVQASHGHYCSPRDDEGPWHEVEVGFPSQRIEELMPYAEDSDRPTDTVCAWVPIAVVEAVIAAHGGSKQLDD